MEIPTEKISHIDVRMEGLNGQLPNLDLVNLVHRLFQQERFVTTLKERVGYLSFNWGQSKGVRIFNSSETILIVKGSVRMSELKIIIESV